LGAKDAVVTPDGVPSFALWRGGNTTEDRLNIMGERVRATVTADVAKSQSELAKSAGD
jgi:hypothetical protein